VKKSRNAVGRLSAPRRGRCGSRRRSQPIANAGVACCRQPDPATDADCGQRRQESAASRALTGGVHGDICRLGVGAMGGVRAALSPTAPRRKRAAVSSGGPLAARLSLWASAENLPGAVHRAGRSPSCLWPSTAAASGSKRCRSCIVVLQGQRRSLTISGPRGHGCTIPAWGDEIIIGHYLFCTSSHSAKKNYLLQKCSIMDKVTTVLYPHPFPCRS
jgi:hypothetical protein